MRFSGRFFSLLGLAALVMGLLPAASGASHGKPVADSLARFRSHGPDGGRVVSVAIDRGGALYAGIGTPTTGVYKSADDGRHWATANNGLYAIEDAFGEIEAIATDPTNSGTVYATYGNLEGVYKSTDGAAHWFPTGRIDQYELLSLAIDPSDPRVVYVGSGYGVYKTTNGGGRWSFVGLDGTKVTALAVNPAHPSTVYAGGQDLWRSTDAGSSWTRLDTPGVGMLVSSIAVDPADPHVVYIAGKRIDRSRPEVIKTRDGGITWEVLRPNLGRSVQPGSIVVDPVQPHTVYLSTSASEQRAAGVQKSSDAGRTWAKANDGLPRGGVLALAASPGAEGTVLVAGTNGGVFVSANRGRRWRSANRGLAASVVMALAVNPDQPSVVFAGVAGDGLYESIDNGRHWRRAGRGIPRSTSVEAVAVAPSNPQLVYAVAGNRCYASVDAGRTWELRSGPLFVRGQAPEIVVSSTRPARLYIGSRAFSRQVLKSTDGGRHWVLVVNGLTGYLSSLAIDPERPWVLHAATNEGVFTTRDGGASWTKASGANAPGSAGAVTVDPVHPTTVYAGGYVSVYKSLDRGQTWARYDWGGSGDVQTTAMAVDPADPSVVFLGTNEYFAEGGLERSTDGGVTWRMVEGVPAPITRLAIGDSIVHVGTSGHAVFNGSDVAGLHRSL